MIYRILLILFSLSLIVKIKAQVNIAVQIPATGVMQKNQLWNVSIVNSSNQSQTVYLELSFISSSNNKVVFTAKAGPVILPKGIKQVTSKEAGPIIYNFSPGNYDRNPNGFLPIGNYTVCFTASKLTGDALDLLAEDCVPVEVEPLSPPMLNYPANEAIISVSYPQFNWIPPAPALLFSDISYDLNIVEILTGQTPEEAMQKNMPVYTARKRDVAHVYPTSARSLDTGKLYAWYVVAREQQQYAARSEVWTFRIVNEKPVEDIVALTPFVKMKKTDPEKSIAPDAVLKLSYFNDLPDSLVTVIVSENTDKDTRQFVVPIKRGENFIQYPLRKLFSPQEDKLYEASIINSKGEKWVLRFYVRYYNKK